MSKDDPGNPFTVDGYDCLAFVNSMVSTTKDPNVAASFARLRSSPGMDHVGKKPRDDIELACRLEYPSDGQPTDGAIFKARQMEEKWDIYLYEDHLYFARSWTGALVYSAHVVTMPDRLLIDRVLAARQETVEDDRYPLRQVDYLLKSHVLKRPQPHPLPPGLKREPEAVGFFSFSQFGHLCCFGTFEETLQDRLVKPQPDSGESSHEQRQRLRETAAKG